MRLFYLPCFAIILGLFWPLSASAQSGFGPYEYVSPRPDAILVNAGTTIAVRHGDEIDSTSLSANLFTVTGDSSGAHSGSVILADDKQTVIFTPDAAFSPGESVSVDVAGGIRTSNGTQISDSLSFSFTVSTLTSVQASSLHQSRLANALDTYDGGADSSEDGISQIDELTSSNLLTGTQSYATIPATFPHISVTVPANGAGEGYIFAVNLTRRSDYPYLLILENNGDPVYHRAMDEGVRFRDFRVQPNGLLTYFNQPDFSFHGMDDSYQVVTRYTAGNGYLTDFHGLQVNEEGHALLQIYDDQPIDMSQVVAGGLVTATVTGAIVQELDPSGNVIFEWRSWDHFDILDASDQIDFTSDDVDVTHINSADWDFDGNIIMSNRNIDEITKVSRASADVIWRFGGKKNQFTLTNADEDGVEFFNWQHDARRQATGTMTLYDNGNHKDPPRSRAVEFELDEENLTATQVWQYRNVPDFFGVATGNVQRLPNGNSVINWGGVGINEHLPFITEVTPDGTKAYEAYFVENESTYRTFRYPWEGRPFEPSMLVASSIGDPTRLHYSWNGATNVASYDIYAGATTNPADFGKIENQPKDGFETVSEIGGPGQPCRFYMVVPIDEDGVEGIPSNLLFAGDDSCTLVATIAADAATNVTLPAPEAGGSVAIDAPAGVVSDTVTLVLNDILSPTQPLPDEGNLVMAFTLEAQDDGAVLSPFSFIAPISLTVTYSDSAVAGLDASTLAIRYWNHSQQAWLTDGLELTGADVENNQLSFTTEHLTLFALFAEEGSTTEPTETVTELLSDGSFEMAPADSPWSYWTRSEGMDANSLSCATHSCGYDNVQTHEGERVVFVGFFESTEEVTITQSIDVSALPPVTDAQLSVWIMRRAVEGSVPFAGNNTIQLFIDDNELLSITDLELQEGRYVELTADLTQYLNGTHTLGIKGSFEADSGAFYIDDVTLKVTTSNKLYLPFVGLQVVEQVADVSPLSEAPQVVAAADYTETDSGLKYFDFEEGEGALPESGQSLSVHYIGWLVDGTKFDSSLDRNAPLVFTIGQGQVIQGWDEGVATMKIGGKRQLVIPPELAYGDSGAGGVIPGGATLIFEVELLDAQ